MTYSKNELEKMAAKAVATDIVAVTESGKMMATDMSDYYDLPFRFDNTIELIDATLMDKEDYERELQVGCWDDFGYTDDDRVLVIKIYSETLYAEGLTALTINNVQDFIGKRIYFFSRQYEANPNIEGVGIITAVDLTQRNVIIGFDREKGEDCMNYAFVDYDNKICLGDGDRPILVKILANE